MEKQRIPQDVVLGAERPIRLRVAGEDLLLSGRFEKWMPLIAADGKEEQGLVQVLFDVTSHARNKDVSKPDADDLFSFTASKVERVGSQTYRLKGTIRADGVSKPVEAVLQSPEAHTPFFVITFPIDRRYFVGLWETLEKRVSGPANGGQLALRPQAWIREPELAAA